MKTVAFHGVDIENEFVGIYGVEIPDVLSRASAVIGQVELPAAAGAYAAGPGRIGSRQFTIKLQVKAADVFANRVLIQNLFSLCGTGLIQVALADRANILIYARLRDVKVAPLNPSFDVPWANLECLFEADQPYWREISVQSVRFDDTLTPMPLGNATSAPDFLIRGPGNVITLTLADSSGTTVRASIFDVNLGANDSITIRTANELQSITHTTAGVAVDAPTLLRSGSLFPKQLDPHTLGNPYTASWGHLKVTAGSGGQPVGSAIYPRMFL